MTRPTNYSEVSIIKSHLIHTKEDTKSNLRCHLRKALKMMFENYIGCSFKFILKAGVEESIVKAPRITVTDHGSAV
jgi:hypothetical protein